MCKKLIIVSYAEIIDGEIGFELAETDPEVL